MGPENLSHAHNQNASDAVGAAADQVGKMGQIGADFSKGLGKAGSAVADGVNIHDRLGSMDTIMHKAGPTEEDRLQAELKLAEKINKIDSPSERAALMDLSKALTGGDKDAFAKALTKVDPAELKKVVDDLNDFMTSSHCSTRIGMTEDGKVLLGERGRDSALVFDPKTGDTSTRKVETLQNGGMHIVPGEVMFSDSSRTFGSISDHTVNRLDMTFEPGRPFFPGVIARDAKQGIDKNNIPHLELIDPKQKMSK
ncbi:MAG: hypothetical protein JSS83_02405 [Cyanobacteria bacterium SZAS LIN-3]|nr:hypothetical protein [Cyanobacteria bacterium SZAS LIN-3]